MQPHFRPTFCEIDLAAIRHNVRQHFKVMPPGASLMAVVKADGYGHGAVPVLKAAIEAGATWAAVALVEEGMELRQAGITCPILLLGGWVEASLPALEEFDLVPTIHSTASAQKLNAYGKKRGKAMVCHLKFDTGMGRLGFHEPEFLAWWGDASQRSHLDIQGIWSHFASADEGDPGFSIEQQKLFNAMLARLQPEIKPQWLHICNSAGTAEFDWQRGNLFRVGIALYGLPPSQDLLHPLDLQPALSWKTGIVQLQDFEANCPISYGRTYFTPGPSRIATLPVGYADGYNRLLSNLGQVLVRGQTAPVVGRVCMDMIMIDVTKIPGVTLEDQVTLVGRDQKQEISATQMAGWLKTINYEITCRISGRVPRLYLP